MCKSCHNPSSEIPLPYGVVPSQMLHSAAYSPGDKQMTFDERSRLPKDEGDRQISCDINEAERILNAQPRSCHLFNLAVQPS